MTAEDEFDRAFGEFLEADPDHYRIDSACLEARLSELDALLADTELALTVFVTGTTYLDVVRGRAITPSTTVLLDTPATASDLRAAVDAEVTAAHADFYTLRALPSVELAVDRGYDESRTTDLDYENLEVRMPYHRDRLFRAYS